MLEFQIEFVFTFAPPVDLARHHAALPHTMFILCAGMFRSGSTWQYQVAAELIQTAGQPVRGLGYLNPADFLNHLQTAPRIQTHRIFKCHDPHPAFADLLRRGELKVLYSFRDLRDVVYSMAHKWNCSATDIVLRHRIIERTLSADRFWREQPGVYVQRYRDWMEDNALFVRGIASHLLVPLSNIESDRIALKFSIHENRKRTEDLARRLQMIGKSLEDPFTATFTDRDSMLHFNHIRQGKVGHWRELATDAEKAIIAERCGDWLIAQGYEENHDWAKPSGS